MDGLLHSPIQDRSLRQVQTCFSNLWPLLLIFSCFYAHYSLAHNVGAESICRAPRLAPVKRALRSKQTWNGPPNRYSFLVGKNRQVWSLKFGSSGPKVVENSTKEPLSLDSKNRSVSLKLPCGTSFLGCPSQICRKWHGSWSISQSCVVTEISAVLGSTVESQVFETGPAEFRRWAQTFEVDSPTTRTGRVKLVKVKLERWPVHWGNRWSIIINWGYQLY